MLTTTATTIREIPIRPRCYPNKRVTEVVYSDATNDFSERDWCELAMAALDQAGLAAAEQEQVRRLLHPLPGAGEGG